MREKHQAILGAARRVFGRVGYVGASIEVIATEADVSTRTIYNHFGNKEALFAAVLVQSSRQLALAREALIERFLTDIDDLEADLVALAREWVRPRPEFADHFAIVRRIRAETEPFPQRLRDAWLTAGPKRARHALATRMARLADEGLIKIGNPEFAAQHFLALITDTTTTRAEFSATARQSEIERYARAGVHAFLYGYLP